MMSLSLEDHQIATFAVQYGPAYNIFISLWPTPLMNTPQVIIVVYLQTIIFSSNQ